MPMDWTPPPRGGGREPNLNQVFDQFKQRMPGLKKIKGLWMMILLIIVVIAGASSFFQVEPEETGVVLRFGKFVRNVGPGLHMKIPFGVEDVALVKTGRVYTEEFGFRGAAPNARIRTVDNAFSEESLMLSGDLNVIDVKWIVQYQIRDPRLWLFAVRDVVAVIRDMSEAVMRRIVGNSYSDAVITAQRIEVAAMAKKELQDLMDEYKTGIQIVTVMLQDVTPPGPVQPAFNEVNESLQQKERLINEAQENYNREIPRASGEAQAIINQAEGYATATVNRAEGEAQRFREVFDAYRSAPEVTKRRFYLDAMQKVMNNAAKVYVVDDNLKGLLPLLDLNKGAAAPVREGAK